MLDEYQHVHEKFRHILFLSEKERLAFLDEPRWIGYATANTIIDNLQGLMNKAKRPRMPNLLIIGDSNNGKTTLVNHFSKKFGVTYLNDNQDAVIPIVTIQAPPSANEKELYITLIEFFGLPYRSTKSSVDLRYQVLHAFRELNVKMLIIDEIHSLLTGTPRQQRQIMNTIKLICNELQIPIVGVGTKDAIRVLHTDPQHASRFDVAEIPIWSNNNDFKKLLGSFEKIMPLKKASNLQNSELATQIYHISDGNLGNIHRLLVECTSDAIKQGEEFITLNNIEDKSWLRPTQGLRKIIK